MHLCLWPQAISSRHICIMCGDAYSQHTRKEKNGRVHRRYQEQQQQHQHQHVVCDNSASCSVPDDDDEMELACRENGGGGLS